MNSDIVSDIYMFLFISNIYFHYKLGTEDIYADEVCDAFNNIEQTETGYRLAMDVPSVFFKYIIGKKGEAKKKIEMETRTQIKIPRQGDEGEIGMLKRVLVHDFF